MERIAAICHPIMKANHLSIMTLEEHEANTEFVGRNFNAGEIIQLVLKSYRTGQWLSFRTVQMVMMHELAHCNQMNHSRAFWKVRNQYAGELRGLWQKGYTGDGLWGRGQTLLSGEYDRGGRAEEDLLPDHLCGGAYRSARRRKRRRAKPASGNGTETYAEKKQRRIAKKFGVTGQALGGDSEVRVKLEKGQDIKAQPRVANSSRGRELRVAAALARFGQQKEEGTKEEASKAANDGIRDDSSSGTQDEYEEGDDGSEGSHAETSNVTDQHGRGMIRVCGTEDQDDVHVKEEMDELRGLDGGNQDVNSVPQEDAETTDEDDETSPVPGTNVQNVNYSNHQNGHQEHQSRNQDIPCSACSTANAPDAALCLACSNVLDQSKVPDHWRCTSDTCNSSEYVNAGDCGICGACGERKPNP